MNRMRSAFLGLGLLFAVSGVQAQQNGVKANIPFDFMERQHILRALRQTEWRIAGVHGAASILGMKRTTLQARMRKLGIRRPI